MPFNPNQSFQLDPTGFDPSQAFETEPPAVLSEAQQPQTYKQTGTNETRPFMNQAYQVLQVPVGRGVDAFSEEAKARAKDLPEILDYRSLPDEFWTSENAKTIFGIGLRTALIPDDRERADALRAMGIEVEDQGGLQFAKTKDGQEFVINKPGMSKTDLYATASQIALFAPAAKAAGMGASIWSKTGLGALFSGATSVGVQETQEALGGEYDTEEVVLDTALGAGAEVIGPLFGKAWAKFSPTKKAAIESAETLDDLVDAGVSRKQANELTKRYVEEGKLADELGVKRPLGAQTLAGDASTDFQRPLVELRKAAATDASLAREATERFESQSRSMTAALKKETATETGALESLESMRTESKGIIDDAKKIRKTFFDQEYPKAFADAPKVDLDPIRREIDDLISSQTAPNTPARKKLEQLKSMFTTDEYEAALKAQKQAIAEASQVYDARGNLVKAPLPPLPKREMTPELLQEINWVLRDIQNLTADTSTLGSVKKKARVIERFVTEKMDISTKGKYSKTDKAYSEFSNDIEKILQGSVGEAAAKSDTTLKNFQTALFNPRPENVQNSKRFMDTLRRRNPNIANDLHSNYIASKLGSLDPKANAEDIFNAVFGRNEDTANVVIELASGPEQKARLSGLRRILDSYRKGTDISITATTENIVDKEAKSNWKAIIGKMFVFGQSSKQALAEISIKDRATVMFQAAINDDFAKELGNALRGPPSQRELEKLFKSSFIKRALARTTLRNDAETLTKAAAIGLTNTAEQ
jgi:hypothetical protein